MFILTWSSWWVGNSGGRREGEPKIPEAVRWALAKKWRMKKRRLWCSVYSTVVVMVEGLSFARVDGVEEVMCADVEASLPRAGSARLTKEERG